MNSDLPSSNHDYKKPEYWNARFEKEDYYEWLVDYKTFRKQLLVRLQNIDKRAKILQLGCGNSDLGMPSKKLLRRGHWSIQGEGVKKSPFFKIFCVSVTTQYVAFLEALHYENFLCLVIK